MRRLCWSTSCFEKMGCELVKLKDGEMRGKALVLLAGVLAFAGCSTRTSGGPAGNQKPEARAVATVAFTEEPTADAAAKLSQGDFHVAICFRRGDGFK